MTRPLRMRIRLTAIAAAIAAALAWPAAAAADVVPGQVLVRYEAGSAPADRADARGDAGARAIEGLGMRRAQLLRITDGDSVSATVRQLEAQPGVAYAEPNQLLEPAMLPNDPLFLDGLQWGLFNDGQTINGIDGTPGADIAATAAWNLEIGDPGTVVAVMDTGADLQHLDQSQLWTNTLEATGTPGLDDDGNGQIDDVNGFDFEGNDPDPTDLSGHGTHVSGIALAKGDNGIGVTGVSQQASLMSLRICRPIWVDDPLDPPAHWSATCPTSDLIEAINYAANNNARVANGSIAGGDSDLLLSAALNSHPDTLYVFAAGNDGTNNDTVTNFPCGADEVGGYTANNLICVAATDQDDDLAGFSNYGANSVDLGAPGANILSTSSFSTVFSDDFEVDDFATEWTNTNTPPDPVWTRTNEAPLSSFGITDSPGDDYLPNAVNEVTSNPLTLTGSYSTCNLSYYRSVDRGSGDTFVIEVLLNGGVVATGVPARVVNGFGSISLHDPVDPVEHTADPVDLDAGDQVQVRLRLTSDNNPGTEDGVHMDRIELTCYGSPSDDDYKYLYGTSMAAPMVAGAAALLFSDDAGATASQVRNTLLGSVDPLPDLAGTTVSGGRLNAYRALAGQLNPAGGGGGGSTTGTGSTSTGTVNSRPNTFFNRKPGRVVRTEAKRARVVFRFGSNEGGSSFRCRLDRGAYAPCAKRFVRRLRPGRHVLKVKAVDSQGAEDLTAAVARFRVKRVEG